MSTTTTSGGQSHSSPVLEPECKDVVIVGAGIAGLMAAKTMVDKQTKDSRLTITIVEADDWIGGRIRGDRTLVEGHTIDLGAEFIHGQGTVLTDLLDQYYPDATRQEIFITAHADGGPSSEPTSEGKYGMYYWNNELVMYNDDRLDPLHQLLEEMTDYRDLPSIGHLLERLPLHLQSLANAGYSNTAGCSDAKDLSLPALLDFEEYWERNEIEGDSRLDSRIGMAGFVERLWLDLKESVHLELGCRVSSIVAPNDDGDAEKQVVVRTIGQGEMTKTIMAGVVIVTAPPPLWPQIMTRLTLEKKRALDYLGLEGAVKCIVKLSRSKLQDVPWWNFNLQSIVCADSPIPEIWFREVDDCVLAVGFLTSTAANVFLRETEKEQDSNKAATRILLDQLSTVLGDGATTVLDDAWLDTRVHSWPFGYMYPRVGFAANPHLVNLAQPMGSILFAGEATHTGACCTVQAAMETGVRAANEALEILRERVEV